MADHAGSAAPTQVPRLTDLPLFHHAAPAGPPGLDHALTRVDPATPAAVPASPSAVSRAEERSRARVAARGRRREPGRARSEVGLTGYDGRTVDWALVRVFRQRASQALAEQLRSRPGIDEEDRRELGRSIIRTLLEDHARADALDGTRLMDLADEEALAAAIFDSLFGLGRLQPLVDLPDVENIEITGHDNVLLLYADGRREVGPPVADSDEELVDVLAFLAAQRGGGERSFSSANPVLHLNLGGRARLAAIMEVSQRPVVRIRKHLLPHVSLATMREVGTVDPLLEQFLAAAVRARKSVVVSGAQGSGKTTFMRALADALDPWESVGTLETEYEVFLHEQGRPRQPIALEARPGSGELGPHGRRAGAITIDDLFEHLLRFNLDRIIVGEVRGGEVMAMFKAMQSGAGSLSTTHAKNARDTIERLVTCVLSVHANEAYAARLVAQHIDLIVHLRAIDDPATGRRRRVVSEVIEVDTGEGFRPAVTDLFRAGPDGRALAVGRPSFLDELVRAGFDARLLDGVHTAWARTGADGYREVGR
jgi:pilus assembly protein CpaF